MFERYSEALRSLSALLSAEVVFGDLRGDLLIRLYAVPLHEHRLRDLDVSGQLLRILEPLFGFLGDANFKRIIADVFARIAFCVEFVLTQRHRKLAARAKQWIKNDYGLMRADLEELLASFADDVDAEVLEASSRRLFGLLAMVKCSVAHLTQHTLPLLHGFDARCAEGHPLCECVVHPSLTSSELTASSELTPILCVSCALVINAVRSVAEIGFYFCGKKKCLRDGEFYCARCCNRSMWAQNTEGLISKRDVIALLIKKKSGDNSRQFARKYIENQCLRTQIGPRMPRHKKQRGQKSERRVRDDNENGLP